MATPKLVAEAERLGILPKTEYRREDYFHPREQSRVMKDCEWEKEPVSKGVLFARLVEFNIGFWGLMGPFCWVVLR